MSEHSRAGTTWSFEPPPAAAGTPVVLAAGGEPIPGYVLGRRLGRGGFGEVWNAAGPGGVSVALKFIALGDGGARVELRALDLIKDVRHPHLLAMFGAWQRDGFLILALELADRTLADRLREAVSSGLPGIPRSELLEYMREAAKGIDHLNGINILHRDIKPANLLLLGGGVKVADFGLAKLLEQSLGSNSGSMTPAFAAPEFFGGLASPFSDQYSLAVTYCDLRGDRLPFTGNSAEVMTKHLTAAPDLTMVPEPERPVLERALAKRAADRWPSCRAFVEALAATDPGPADFRPPPAADSAFVAGSAPPLLFTDLPTPPRPAPAPAPRPRRRMALTAVGVVAVAVMLGAWLVRPKNDSNQHSPSVDHFENSLDMPMVLIPAGTFRMGSPADEPGRAADERQQEIVIAVPFYLGRHEVAQDEYRRVAGTAPSFNSPAGKWAMFVRGSDTRRFPVENVSWNEAVEFCRRLSSSPAEQAAGRIYRLPTEAEWEYACRAGTESAFAFGPALAGGQANVAGDSPDHPTPVGSFAPNQFGLCDMHGNVAEWCADAYPAGGHVVRGGSYIDPPVKCRSAARSGEAGRQPTVGFRVVCEIAGETAPVQ